MDAQGQDRPSAAPQPPSDQTGQPSQPAVAAPQAPTPVDPANKPTLEVSDDAARALLTINNVQAVPKRTTKLPLSMIIVIIALILIVVLASFALGNLKPGASSKSPAPQSSGLSNQSNSSDTDKQINQDVKSCSNPAIAISEC